MVGPAENEFSVNYSLVSELLGGDSDDLDDRLADLAELVPDFPIDATEFDTFWNGFRLIAPRCGCRRICRRGHRAAPAVVTRSRARRQTRVCRSRVPHRHDSNWSTSSSPSFPRPRPFTCCLRRR